MGLLEGKETDLGYHSLGVWEPLGETLELPECCLQEGEQEFCGCVCKWWGFAFLLTFTSHVVYISV